MLRLNPGCYKFESDHFCFWGVIRATSVDEVTRDLRLEDPSPPVQVVEIGVGLCFKEYMHKQSCRGHRDTLGKLLGIDGAQESRRWSRRNRWEPDLSRHWGAHRGVLHWFCKHWGIIQGIMFHIYGLETLFHSQYIQIANYYIPETNVIQLYLGWGCGGLPKKRNIFSGKKGRQNGLWY